jgi:hypothetical protein
MCHIPPGIGGLLVGFGVFIGIATYANLRIAPGEFHMDPKGEPRAFEPFLARYIRAGEFIIGLATGSIVLLVGSSALHGQGGRLPWFYASPLLLLALCVVYGIAFIVWLIYKYESNQHGEAYTRFAYILSLTFGFSALVCFIVGYVWLIFCVTA